MWKGIVDVVGGLQARPLSFWNVGELFSVWVCRGLGCTVWMDGWIYVPTQIGEGKSTLLESGADDSKGIR